MRAEINGAGVQVVVEHHGYEGPISDLLRDVHAVWDSAVATERAGAQQARPFGYGTEGGGGGSQLASAERAHDNGAANHNAVITTL